LHRTRQSWWNVCGIPALAAAISGASRNRQLKTLGAGGLTVLPTAEPAVALCIPPSLRGYCAVIRAYINHPRPRMTLHTDSTSSEVGKMRKPNQRVVSVTRVSFATAIGQLTSCVSQPDCIREMINAGIRLTSSQTAVYRRRLVI
jgi:hypothetical protein